MLPSHTPSPAPDATVIRTGRRGAMTGLPCSVLLIAMGAVGVFGAVVIATEAHLRELGQRLEQTGVDLSDLRARDRYLPLLAEETLERFMVRGWPDEDRFAEVVAGILTRARGDGRRVRAFGEMVALLWAQGNIAATVRLEFLWQKLCEAEGFSLFCAYPKAGFTRDLSDSITEICAAHSRVVAA